MEIQTILMRFFIVFLLSIIFGLERQRSHKPIGFGTFIFVSIGSCGLAITALLLDSQNPLPLLSAIITGIGFLGAGALIKTTDKIFGFTTAASIWVFSIIGLVIGVGEYLIGIIMYISVFSVIFIDRYLEEKSIGSYQKKLSIVTNKNIKTEEISSALETKKYKIISIDINKVSNKFSITLLVEGTKVDINQIPKKLFKADWVESFKIE